MSSNSNIAGPPSDFGPGSELFRTAAAWNSFALRPRLETLSHFGPGSAAGCEARLRLAGRNRKIEMGLRPLKRA